MDNLDFATKEQLEEAMRKAGWKEIDSPDSKGISVKELNKISRQIEMTARQNAAAAAASAANVYVSL